HAACCLFLCVPRPAGRCVFDSSATNNLSPIRYNSLHSWSANSRLDVLAFPRATTRVRAPFTLGSHRGLLLRRRYPTCRRRGGVKSIFRATPGRGLSARSFRSKFKCEDFL